MKELLIISGKGGTGKTTVLGSFAALARNQVLADADVDAPNLHLLLSPEPKDERPYSGAGLAIVDEALCIECGRCDEVCEFDAVRNHKVDPNRCEGCGTCALICPANAITMHPQITGHVYISSTRFGLLAHARLHAGAEASGRLVTEVRDVARKLATEQEADLILTDGSPGIGCPVIASLSGVDVALAVTEPTPSGVHDLRRVLAVSAHFGVPTGVCINKWDLNPTLADKIEREATEMKAKPMGRIPFDEDISNAIAEGMPVVEHSKGEGATAITNLWHEMVEFGAFDGQEG